MKWSKFVLPFAVAALAATCAIGPARAASTFTVAGFTFDQNNTPDQIAELTGGIFSTGVTTITQSVAFAAQSIGGGGVISPRLDNEATLLFDGQKTLGEQAYDASIAMQPMGGDGHYGTAINFPHGNAGSTIRDGIEVGWSGGRVLSNTAGDDFAIYESGSNPTTPEGFMVRAELAAGGFTSWYFQANDAFELYLNQPAGGEGSFVHRFDLSDMGLADGALVSGIQIANLIAADTLNGVSGTRTVNVGGGPGTAHGFTSGNLDPDPLYVGIPVGHLVPEPSTFALGALGVVAGLSYGLRRSRRKLSA